MTPGLRCLIAGFGNELAGDDSAGLLLLERISRKKLPPWCHLAAPSSALELVDLMQEADEMLILDAVSSGSSPGAIHVVAFPSSRLVLRSSVSTHGWSVADAVVLASNLGRPMPRLTLVGIEVGDVRIGSPISRPVAAAIDECERQIDTLIGSLAEGAMFALR